MAYRPGRYQARRLGNSALVLALCGFTLICGAAALFVKPSPAAAQAAKKESDFWTRSNMLGDMGGLRTSLAKIGVTFNLQEISEVLGNVTGGVHRGATYDGLTTMGLSLDTNKAFHWPGGTFNACALQIHGTSLSTVNLDNLQVVSGIAGDRATRLWELWYQQTFFNDKADIKIGQQSIDQEFIISQYAGLYLNTMMGWPMVPSADLYAGGPAYPLSSLGIRLRVQPSESLTLLGGVFNDNPPGGPFGDDSQLRDGEASGTRFNMNTGALIIAELQYAVHQSDRDKSGCHNVTCGLPGTYKLGVWYDTASFPDQRFGKDGLSLANPASCGIARMRRGNISIYSVADQMVWRQAQGPRTVGVFTRIMGAPPNRNLISFSLNAGVNLKGLLPGRDNDTLGIGYGLAYVSSSASDLDQDTAFFTGTDYPVRSAEHFVEMTYQIQVTPWWQLQPDFQFIINPEGGVQNPQNPAQRLADEAVFGIRTIITF